MNDDRYDEDWTAYRCSDCDPTLVFDDPDDPAAEYEQPYVLLVPEGDPTPDFCPRCASYLSLCDGDRGLRIANTPAERWARNHQKKEEQHG